MSLPRPGAARGKGVGTTAPADLIMAVLFALMALAIYLDQGVLAGRRRPREAGVDAAPARLPAGAPEALALLLQDAEGWVVVHRDGRVLATNLPRRAALLAAACGALGLEDRGARQARLESGSGTLLAELSEGGLLLAALVRPHQAAVVERALAAAARLGDRWWGGPADETPRLPAP